MTAPSIHQTPPDLQQRQTFTYGAMADEVDSLVKRGMGRGTAEQATRIAFSLRAISGLTRINAGFDVERVADQDGSPNCMPLSNIDEENLTDAIQLLADYAGEDLREVLRTLVPARK